MTTLTRQREAEALAAVFKALGSPIRLRLLAVVQMASDRGVCVCDLIDAVKLTQSTVSHHMAALVEAGLVSPERRGAWMWYTLAPGGLEAVRRLLAASGDGGR